MSESGPPLRILVAYSYTMHYRLGVFAALIQHPTAEVTIAAGTTVLKNAAQKVEPITPAQLPTIQWHQTRAWRSLRWQPTLFKESLSDQYDIVIWDPSIHCLTMWASSITLRARSQTLGYWGLGWTATHGALKERVKVAGFRLAHGFMTYGRRSKELAGQAGYPSDRVYVVGNSMMDNPQAGEIATAGLPPLDTNESPLILGVSLRLTARKRVDQLLRAAALLEAAGHPVQVLIVGDGAQREALEALALELGVNADFLGGRYDDVAIADFYRRVQITVIPGHAGLTVIQSLMFGRPVVTHSNTNRHAAEWEALRDGISGSFFTENDIADLAQHILRVANWIRHDPDQLAQACRSDYLAHGDPRSHAERIVTAAQDIAARHAGIVALASPDT